MALIKPRNPVLNPNHPLSRGLVCAWLMNEGSYSVLRDSGPYRLDSGLVNVPATGWNPAGPFVNFGAATNFYATRADNPVLDIDVPFTIVCRIKRLANVSFAGIFSKGDASTTTGLNYMLREDNAGNLNFRFFNSTTPYETPDLSITNGEWYTIACGWNRAVVWIWGNGVYASTAATSTPNVGSEPLIFGIADNNGLDTARSFNGHMDYVQIFNRPLMDNELWQLHTDPYVAFRHLPVTRYPLSAAVVPTSTVQLSWTDNSSGGQTFSIERSTTSAYAGFAEIATGETGPTYNDSGLADDTYWYRVRGTADGGTTYSDYTNVVEVTTTT